MNDPIKEVHTCYVSVKQGTCIISSHGFRGNIKYSNWGEAYRDFNKVVELSIQNTRKFIKDHEGTYHSSPNQPPKKWVIDEQFKTMTELECLKYIASNNVEHLFIFSFEFLRHCVAVKYYFPRVKIVFFTSIKNFQIIHFLDYVDRLSVRSEDVFKFYDDGDIEYNRKPKISLTKLITFGTFDLFHHGHENVFEKCRAWSENIIVGLSTDEFTFRKKNVHPTDSYEERERNIRKISQVKNVFPEESLELKNDYVKKFDADILVMGDDWEGKFDWVDCCTRYIQYTPGISSTMLRKQLNENK